MKGKKSSKPSLADIARLAGISKSAVCFALQNRPKVSKATRKKVLQIAEQLGYVPDARLTSVMARVRDTHSKDLLPIGWLNTTAGKNDWHRYKFLSPYLEGAQERCRQFGYRLEEIWTRQPGLTMQRISQMLYQQGIEGVIVTYPARHIRLNWDYLAAVSLGSGLLAPRLNCVTIDARFNLLLTLKTLKRLGFRRIGVCLSDHADRLSRRVLRSSAHYHYLMTARENRIPPLFHPGESGKASPKSRKMVAKWLAHYHPEVVVGYSSNLLTWINGAGYRIPQDMGLVHMGLDDDVNDWAGIYSNKRELGRIAAAHVISMVQNRQFGIPDVVSETLVQGSWQNGFTLLSPRPK